MWGLFRKSKQTLCRVHIRFADDFETSWMVAVVQEGSLPTGFENWIWDLYYAKTLYELGICAISEGLKEQLEAWAEQWIMPCLGVAPLPERGLVIDDDLRLTSELGAASEVYVLEVINAKPSLANPKGWPLIQTYLPASGFQNRMGSSVLTFAQYLVEKDKRGFGRMLPIHILAMRKYFSERKGYNALDAVLEAPVFAVNEEMNVAELISESYAPYRQTD